MNKTDKSSNNNIPASHNHSSSEATMEQKINARDNSSAIGTNFPKPLMPVNVFNFDTRSRPKKTILIAGDCMINGINEKRISTNFESVKVRCFSGPMIDYMYFNLIPLLRKKSTTLVSHVRINNSSNKTSFQIYDELLNVVTLLRKTIQISMLYFFHQSIDLMLERQLSLFFFNIHAKAHLQWTY